MSSKWNELQIERIDSWQELSIIAIELSNDSDPYISMHGDIWIDQCLNKFDLTFTI